jgi:predicted acyltransferase
MVSCPGDSNAAPASQRILSVDALRGFDMFWIIGGGGLVTAILRFLVPAGNEAEAAQSIAGALMRQFSHVAWEGFVFEDLIFPLFVFMAGMSTVFSLSKVLAQQGKKAAYWRLTRRTIALFLLGVFYYGGLGHTWPNIRLLGVLQRIALCYFFTGVVFIHCRLRGILITTVLLLAGYWAFLSFVPVPGLGKVTFEKGENWACYIDSQWLIGKRHNGTWDPEGLLSTLPAVGTCLLGAIAALLLRNERLSQRAKLGCLLGVGVSLLLAGYGWGGELESLVRKLSGNAATGEIVWGWYPFPIIKKIWTSSYVLVAGGYSFLLLGIFYALIDVWNLHRWAGPFVWIGTNAITLYMAENILSFNDLASRFVGGNVQSAVGPTVGNLLTNAVSIGLALLLAHFLYKHKIFLRV